MKANLEKLKEKAKFFEIPDQFDLESDIEYYNRVNNILYECDTVIFKNSPTIIEIVNLSYDKDCSSSFNIDHGRIHTLGDDFESEISWYDLELHEFYFTKKSYALCGNHNILDYYDLEFHEIEKLKKELISEDTTPKETIPKLKNVKDLDSWGEDSSSSENVKEVIHIPDPVKITSPEEKVVKVEKKKLFTY